MKARKWMMKYGVAMLLAALLAAIMGQIPLFRETMVGKLRASDLVQFMGYSGALAMIWMGAYQVAKEIPDEWKWIKPFQGIILPLATLLIVIVWYAVLLFPLGPFLRKTGKMVYNWFFISTIIASSTWLIVSWVKKCAPLVEEEQSDSKKLRKAA
ncbi:MAG: hypothetical protein OEY86_18580 [Nitrospira sp.]|nr:hypothetical protein [Nitrospira sp.]